MLGGQAVDHVDLGADRPLDPGGRRRDRLEDELGRAVEIGRLHHLAPAFRVDDDLDARVIAPRLARSAPTVKRAWTEHQPRQRIRRARRSASTELPPSGRRGSQTTIASSGMPSLTPVLRPRCSSGKKSTRSPRSNAHSQDARSAFDEVQTMPPPLAAERLERGGRVHVGDRDDRRRVRPPAAPSASARAGVQQGAPRLVGHVGHRAAGGEVGQDHPLVIGGEDVGALRHEVHAAEDDVVGVAAAGRLLGELEGVAAEVGPADDLVALVVVAEDDQPRAEPRLRRREATHGLFARHRAIALGNLGLARGPTAGSCPTGWRPPRTPAGEMRRAWRHRPTGSH